MRERPFQRRFREYAMGNVFIREMAFARSGDVVQSHAHNFDHVTYCVAGSLQVDRGSETVFLEPGDSILIVAGTEHKITAHADLSLGHCIYAHRTPQGEIVQEFTGWRDSYI